MISTYVFAHLHVNGVFAYVQVCVCIHIYAYMCIQMFICLHMYYMDDTCMGHVHTRTYVSDPTCVNVYLYV